jgi:hypothetical protein
MNATLKTALRQQYGAAIDMLENAVRACPDELWQVRLWDDPTHQAGLAEFWYIVYHTLFWLDLYLSGSVEGFVPPAPFTLEELDPAGILPERPYSKVELRSYLEHTRTKCQTTIDGLTDGQAGRICAFAWGQLPFVELLLDTMRHVQEHTAQLNMILGQKTGWDPGWVTTTKSKDT